jgi:polar amino acid transport system substrate-binding protein
MKRLLFIGLLSLFLDLPLVVGLAPNEALAQQTGSSAPTLVPPTLVPTIDPGTGDVLLSESTVARIIRDGVVRVGVLYNAPPFGELNVRGEVAGYDADLARNMAETWGMTSELIQVTRQTAVEALTSGQVDMLLAAQVHHRQLDAQAEFSQTYYVDSQSMMVRADDGASVLGHMADRKVGVVLGSSGEQAVAEWLRRSNLPVTVQTYLTLDQTFVALVNKEVDGVVESRIRLTTNIPQLDLVKMLDEPVTPEPYTVVMRRQDVSLRNLVNRTLQFLVQNGTMKKIYEANFSGLTFPEDTIPLWTGIGEDAPKPDQFASEIIYPTQYAVPRILSNKVIRVAGVTTVPEDAPESQRRLELLNRSLIERMAQRWGVTVEYLPDSAANALDLVASGQADLAVGAQPDWAWADRVDFTGPYLLHGQRLMVPKAGPVESFVDLRGGKWVAIATNEPDLDDRAVELATSVNARIEVYFAREQDIALAMLVETNADVAFGDSLKLIPHVQANPDQLRLTETWYSRSYTAFAVPRNDLDFRLLVEYTLQELVRDGTLNSLLQPVMLPEEIPTFEIWPGSSDYLGLALAAQ